ncbi:MAG TPA: hypothetical protein GX015_00035, partial [Corynebacterium sp.]|uniref:hypothetical protein n=1 Tax=Corynebacterium sp. TaxID=1720 RepID=UPI001836CEAA
MNELSGNDDKSRAISEVPEYILRAIVRMGEPSVQAIERILPAQHKKLAADIHRRLVRGDRRDADGDSGNDGAATAATAASATAPVTSGEDAGRASWAVDETAAAPVAAPVGHFGPAPSLQAGAAPAQSDAA